MKNRYLIVLIFSCFTVFSQSNKVWNGRYSDLNSRLSLTLGFNVIDSSGENGLFSLLKDPETMALNRPFTAIVDYRFSRWLALAADVSLNQWKANQGVINSEVVKRDVNYFSYNLGFNIYLDNFFNLNPSPHILEVYLQPNLGYFKINSMSTSFNLGLGFTIWMTNSFSLNMILQNKSRMNSNPSKLSISHQQAIIGLRYSF